MLSKRENLEYNVKYCALQAMNMFVSAVLSAFLVPLLQSQGFSAWKIGVLIAVKCCSTIVFSPLYACLADRVALYLSNKFFICIFCGLGILFTLMHLFIPLNFAKVIVIFIGYGASFSCIGSFADSLSSQYSSNGVRLNYAFARAIGSLFWALAGLVLGYLTEAFSTEAILWLQVVALAVCLLVAILQKDPNKIKNNISEKKALDSKKKIQKTSSLIGMLIHYPFYLSFLIACLFLMTGVNMTMSYMAYTVAGVGGSNFDLGMNGFVLGFFEIFVGFYFAFFLKRLGTRKLILLAMFGMVLRVAMLVVAQNILMVYVAQVFEMAGCMLWGANVQMVEDEIPVNDRIKGQAMVSIVQTGISALVASVLGGFLMDKYNNVLYIHVYALVLGFFGISIYFLSFRLQNRKMYQ